jgi:hypothetical protein
VKKLIGNKAFMTDNFRAATIEVFYEITLSGTLDDCG